MGRACLRVRAHPPTFAALCMGVPEFWMWLTTRQSGLVGRYRSGRLGPNLASSTAMAALRSSFSTFLRIPARACDEQTHGGPQFCGKGLAGWSQSQKVPPVWQPCAPPSPPF
eukprot:1146653-Pelagomonas_calceolata.AAC.6